MLKGVTYQRLSEDLARVLIFLSSRFIRAIRLGWRDDLARPRLLRIDHHIRIDNRRRHHCFRASHSLRLFLDSRINLGGRDRRLQLRGWGGWRLNRCFLPRGRVRRQCDSRPCAQEKNYGTCGNQAAHLRPRAYQISTHGGEHTDCMALVELGVPLALRRRLGLSSSLILARCVCGTDQ